ncbi:DUF362 domain-containing protein [Candidatus Xianfuyuplasma coldseepsis]|uniref:DUF362 domain-containing protein n=1 Tax=Candidatus Xianfuyuplasma coldseepsis TaxID=2782163 RepID=A0A7L7KPR7_9MOLU|nr:DUF362 domain-containing protein [Xianfuyuplasma coldseepsis]QMS84242.1 DUF362 domain-containing protein [Xianfuyuplasma coldseepsis]
MNKVILIKCNDYNLTLVTDSIKSSLENLGGLDKYVKPGESVLLKVNLLTIKKPEQAATTHPVFVEALVNIFLDHGCKVTIADSPGGPFVSSMVKRVYKATGMKDLASRYDITLNDNYNSSTIFTNDSKL